VIDDEFNRLKMEGEKRFAEEAAEALQRVTEALNKLNQSARIGAIQFLRWKIYTMPWKRNSRKRQMMKACAMMERGPKTWEVF